MKKKLIPLLLLFLVLVLLFFYALSTGSYSIGTDIFHSVGIIIHQLGFESIGEKYQLDKTSEIILLNLRLPRIFLTILTGMALSVAGAIYQACFKNPLVEPYLLGVSSGAAFGAALAIIMPFSLFIGQGQVLAFFFAILAVSISYFLATTKSKTSPLHLILSGIVVGAVFSALVSIIKYIAEDAQLREITFWMMGGFYYAHWQDVIISSIVVLPSIALAIIFSWQLNILSLGDEEATSLGINPNITRLAFLTIATLIASVCVSQVGIIAWVGLMIPHAARMLFGSDNRILLISSALMGAIYMLLCDTIARNLTSTEIPIGIISAILGSPYLIWLLRSKGRLIHAS